LGDGWSHNAVDVIEPAIGKQALHFTIVEGTMFEVQPNAIETQVRRVANVVRQVIAEPANSYYLIGLNLL
jgi:hypothetical protein